MTARTERLDELLRQEISRIVARDVHDSRVGFVTITRVDVAPDLHHARVYASLIGQPGERRAAFRALAHSMPFIRRQLGVLHLRRIPELHLELDDSVERGTRVLRILEDLEAGRQPEPPEHGETLPTPGPPALPAAGSDAGDRRPTRPRDSRPAGAARRPRAGRGSAR